MLESRFCGLPFSRLQYQYRIFTNGLSRLVNMGQTTHDGSSAHFPDHGGTVGSSRGKHSLASSVKAQPAESTSLWPSVCTNSWVRPTTPRIDRRRNLTTRFTKSTPPEAFPTSSYCACLSILTVVNCQISPVVNRKMRWGGWNIWYEQVTSGFLC